MRVPLKIIVASVCALAFPSLTERPASAQEAVKPYIIFIMDVSGSMLSSTGSGPPSCGGEDTLIDHAKCALRNITNTYGDVVLALGRFRQTQGGVGATCGTACDADGIGCFDCWNEGNPVEAECTTAMASGDRFELLVPLIDDNQDDVNAWVDLTCSTCSLTSSMNPELAVEGWTPLAGSLKGAKRYLQGLSTPGDDTNVGTVPYWTGTGADPIRNDPLKDIFPLTDPDGAQCRPYIVILLTDGEETCTYFTGDFSPEPGLAAASLLNTVVDSEIYRIETKPIGFGIAPPSGGNINNPSEIEDIAHSGGEADVPGQNEGYYATDEVSLSKALADIIRDALKFETCNGLDDDCDIAIDEDFPLKDTGCDNGLSGVCFSPGTWMCTADGSGLECILDNPGHPLPNTITEICNGLDDDCDGLIDEGLDCTSCLSFELCDGLDNNCDGNVDEGGITRPCGSDVGICEAGEQTCVDQGPAPGTGSGIWGACDDVEPRLTELCNAEDDDCDGVTDGLSEQCWTSPENEPTGLGGTWVGVCAPGTRTCPTDGSLWGPCIGEITPAASDLCDGSDNDCDGETDEDFVASDCSGTCGTGQTFCDAGTIRCDATDVPEDEICDGIDNDCDGVVDEDIPDDGPCTDDGRCVPGTLVCDASTGGKFECRGGELPGIEICDCLDNDCDTSIDEEDPNPLCAPGASCVSCECAFPCDTGEFPCPVGRVCQMGFCLLDTCYGVDCPPDGNGDKTECVDANCVRSCDLVSCNTGSICDGADGVCKPDNCISFPDQCSDNEFCLSGECQADPCFEVDCDAGAGEYCANGSCIGSCAGVQCPEGQRCEMGACVTDPCGETCPSGQVCDPSDGRCKSDPCEFAQCPEGQACNPDNGTCQDDPCLGITCPAASQVCQEGSCYDPADLEPPDKGPDPQYVAPGGGGGCQTGSGGSSSALLLLGLGFLGLRLRRQRGEA